MNFVNVNAYDDYLNANMQLSMLQEQGINCHLKDEHTLTIDPLLSPAIGGIKLMVAAPQVERALRILEQVEQEWLQGLHCPVCGQLGLRKTTTVTEFPGLWGKLKSMLANGQEREIKTVYSCAHCHTEFDKLPFMS